jgi:hypothetical protein
MNALFRSPLFDTAASFNNPLYNAPLRPWSPYELIWSSGRFIEGSDGAAGFHWLLLFPVIVLAFTRRRPVAHWLCLALAAIVFVGVYSQQSYLRYLLPAFALIAVLGGWALAEIPDRRSTRLALLVIGGMFCLVNVRLMYTGSWANLSLCPACGVDPRARHEHIAQFAPDRLTAEYLNRELPNARVGFYVLNGVPAGYVGYSRAANWHDYPTFRALTHAESADDVLAHAQKFALTHIVYRDPPYEFENVAMREFRERYTCRSGARTAGGRGNPARSQTLALGRSGLAPLRAPRHVLDVELQRASRNCTPTSTGSAAIITSPDVAAMPLRVDSAHFAAP